MPRFEPFRALRYAPDLISEVTAPPYDVLSPSDRNVLAQRHVDNIVHIDLPLESDGPTRYTMAAGRLNSWLSKGVLTIDETPSLTVYRMKFLDSRGRSRSTSGVIGALEVVDENAGGVLPHERTTPKAKTDRLDLTRATECNLSPVWGLSLGSGLTSALTESGEPMGSVDVDGVVHSFERISEPSRIAEICAAISAHDVVIADGHHRYAISRTYRDELRLAHSPIASAAELTMTYVAELVEEQLSVAAIHRLYDIADTSAFDSAIRDHFDIIDSPPLTPKITDWMESNGCLVLLRPEQSPIATASTKSAINMELPRSPNSSVLVLPTPPS
jgi:uncharacterized protein (DUF1015 family)